MSCYDAVIKLNQKLQYRSKETFEQSQPKSFTFKSDRKPVLPILEFNPVDLYVKDLRVST